MFNATVFVLTFTDGTTRHEFLGAFSCLDSAKSGAERRVRKHVPGGFLKWESTGTGARVDAPTGRYDIAGLGMTFDDSQAEGGMPAIHQRR